MSVADHTSLGVSDPGKVGIRRDMLVDGDSVSLTLPAEGFVDVARRVLGGAAGMADFGFEEIDDLQLALELVLRAGVVAHDRATVTIAVDATGLTVKVREVDESIARRGLQAREKSRVVLGGVLDQVLDDVRVAGDPVPELVLHKARSSVVA